MKIIHDRERKKKKNKDRKKKRVGARYSERVKTEEFCCAFKVRFCLINMQAFFNFQGKFRVNFINYFKRKKIIRAKTCYHGA